MLGCGRRKRQSGGVHVDLDAREDTIREPRWSARTATTRLAANETSILRSYAEHAVRHPRTASGSCWAGLMRTGTTHGDGAACDRHAQRDGNTATGVPGRLVAWAGWVVGHAGLVRLWRNAGD